MTRPFKTVEKKGVFLAGDSAMDSLNTQWASEPGAEEFFETDKDVLAWLGHAGVAAEGVESVRSHSALLRTAQALRSAIRALVESGKGGTIPDFSDLNAILGSAESHPELL